MTINTKKYSQCKSSIKKQVKWYWQFKRALLTPDKDNVSQWNEIQDNGEHREGNNCQPAQEWDSPVECTKEKLTKVRTEISQQSQ